MIREKHFTHVENETRVDIRFKTKKGEVVDFSINVSFIKNDKRKDVYRVDTAHGYLHEQRFWRSPRPKSLENLYPDYNTAFNQKKKEVMENFKRWIKLFKKKNE